MKVLIVGATGVEGSLTTKKLLAKGIAVRALTRTPAKAEPLRQLGAEVVQGIDADNDVCWFKLRSRPPNKPQDYILLRSWRTMKNPVRVALAPHARANSHLPSLAI